MLAPGTELGPYVVEAVIGQGGQGAVYRVYHRVLRRWDALKAMPVADDAVATRALREAAVLARLDHPNIVRVYTAEIFDHHLCIFMELVPGSSLSEVLRPSPLDTNEALSVFRQIVAAVGHAHERGVVHRDLKPDNVLLDGRCPKVADFGIAKIAGDSWMGAPATGNMALGTPSYMAPEQFRGSAVGPTADIYALGCILYEMIGGSVAFPFLGGSILPLMGAKETARYTPLGARANVPVWLEQVLARCLEPEPERRVQSCEALLELLDHPEVGVSSLAAEGRPMGPARPRSKGLLLLVTLSSLLLVVCAGGTALLALRGGVRHSPAQAGQEVEAPPPVEDRTVADPVVEEPPAPRTEPPAPGRETVPIEPSHRSGDVEPTIDPVAQAAPAPTPKEEVEEWILTLNTCPLPSELNILVDRRDARASGRLVGENRLRVREGELVTLQDGEPDSRPHQVRVREGQTEIIACFPGMEGARFCGSACAEGQL